MHGSDVTGHDRRVSVGSAFRLMVARHPDAIALRTRDRAISYSLLHETAQARARLLLDHCDDASPRVAVAFADGIEHVVWLVAVQLAGLTAVSLDADQPPRRLADLAQRASLSIAVGDDDVLGQLTCKRLDPRSSPSGNGPLPPAVSAHAAYVCFTSGSTGAPKGVEVSRESLAATTSSFAGYLGLPERPRSHVLGTSWGFDVATLDLWLALTTGGSLVLPARADLLGESLVDLLASHEAPVLQTVPSLLSVLPATVLRRLPRAATLVLGGESSTADLLAALADVLELHVAYGVTEATVCSTAGRVEPGATDPTWLGHPLPGVVALVLDSVGGEIETGDVGELWLGGRGLAQGYLGDAAATAAAFLAAGGDGAEAQERRYRTGDLVRRQADGSLTFRGRVDGQLSIRGHRVEPAEVERALSSVSGLRQAAVAQRSDARGAPLLLAYVVGEPDLDVAAVRSSAAELLPQWMLPDVVTALAELPFTANGKVDRDALPQLPAEPKAGQGPPADSSDVDQVVGSLWRELLGSDASGDADIGFVSRGGHSLKAVQMASGLREQLGVAVPISSVLGATSLGSLTDAVRTADPAAPASQGTDEPSGPNAMQRDMCLFQELAGDVGLYNLLVTIDLAGDLDATALEQALQDVEDHHPALRTALWFNDDDLVARVVPPTRRRLRVREIDGDLRAAVTVAVAAAGRTALPLADGVVWEYSLWRAGRSDNSRSHTLLLVIHHAAVDGVSVVALLEELANTYARIMGAPKAPVPSTAQATGTLHTDRADLEVWRTILTPPPTATLLPGQLVSDSFGDLAGIAVPIRWPGVDPAQLHALAAARGCTLQTAVLSCVVRALASLSARDDILVAVPVSRRGTDVPARAIGQFSSALPVPFEVRDATSALDCLDSVSARMHTILDHPRVNVASVLEIVRTGGTGPTHQIAFAWDEDAAPLVMPGLVVDWQLEFNGWSEWGLTVELAAHPEEISGRLCGRLSTVTEADLDRFVDVMAQCGRDLLDDLASDHIPGGQHVNR